jgi:hypothetical protein
MTAPVSLIALAAELVDTNPAASQLIVSLGNAETAVEVVEALNVYDETVLDSLESDEDEDEDEDETDEVEVEVDESELVPA